MAICLYCGTPLSSPLQSACSPEHEAILMADWRAQDAIETQSLMRAETGLNAMYDARP